MFCIFIEEKNLFFVIKYNEIKWNYWNILGKFDVIFFINSFEYLYYRVLLKLLKVY